MTIELTPSELFQAATVGIMRQCQNLVAGRADAYGAGSSDGWGLHVEGAAGEAAVAKLLNCFYSGNIGRLNACDVNNDLRNVEVRTRSKHHYDLILHPKDKDNHIFILLTGKAPVFTVQGWIYGHEGKQPRFWADPAGGRPAYFVPASELRPISSLTNNSTHGNFAKQSQY